ncbi:uncharacterized protein ACIB01_019506 [Guaruba guarouba]
MESGIGNGMRSPPAAASEWDPCAPFSRLSPVLLCFQAGMMQECYDSLLLLEFPIPKPTLISRLEPEEEPGGPDPNDSKEWEILRVALADDGTWSGNDEDPLAPDPPDQPHPDLPLSHGIKDAASPPPPALSPSRLPPEAPSQFPAPNSRRSFPGPPRGLPREKPFKCGDCGKSFTRNSNRNAHQRTHSHSRAIPECGNAVGRRRRACAACAEGPLACAGCGNAKLRRRKHLGMRPHWCAECGKSFSYGSAFLKHQWKHGQDRAPQHSQPGKGFLGSSGLSRHHRSHLG